MSRCPTCSGTGQVPGHVADALEAADRQRTRQGRNKSPLRVGDTCHCGGPPHPYDPSWCRP